MVQPVLADPRPAVRKLTWRDQSIGSKMGVASKIQRV
jgi:hypothetical protein